MTEVQKASFISDIHFPRNDKRALTLWLDMMEWWQPDSIDLVGDIDDSTEVSRWAEGTPAEMGSVESGGVADTRKFLADLKDRFKKADRHLHDGNHGWTRHKAYLEKKAPAYLETVTPDSLYEYSKSGFKWHSYQEPPVARWPSLYVHHGESISKHAGESVRNDVMNWGVSLLRAHSHRQGIYKKTFGISGLELRGYEIGHMSDEKQLDYTLNHDWQKGFAVAWVHNNHPHVQLIEITKDYTAVLDGKLFSG